MPVSDEPNDLLAVPDEPLLNAKQVAKLLSVHILTVRSWTREGKLQSLHLAKRAVRYRRADVYEFMRLHERTKPKPIRRAAPSLSRKKIDRNG